jgi:hypothetical protein
MAYQPGSAGWQGHAGWYQDPRNPDQWLFWDGMQWRDADQTLLPKQNGWAHFGWFLLVAIMVSLLFYVIVGWILVPLLVFRRTGYRARDVLWLFVPIWGAVVEIRTIWRWADRRVYWTPRPDLWSKPLFGPGIVPNTVMRPALTWQGPNQEWGAPPGPGQWPR